MGSVRAASILHTLVGVDEGPPVHQEWFTGSFTPLFPEPLGSVRNRTWVTRPAVRNKMFT